MLPPRWRRRPLLSAMVLGLLLAAVADRAGSFHWQPDDQSRYHNKTFRVVNVTDGDTFDIDVPDGQHPSTRIDLWGVDAPEVTDTRHGPMSYGSEAFAFVRKMLLGSEVRIELSPTRSRDGEHGNCLLAYVYLGDSGEMLNELLLATGRAYADPRIDHVRAERFRQLEAKAARDRTGLWRDLRPDQLPAWKQDPPEDQRPG